MRLKNIIFEENVKLSGLTTLGVGGVAKYFATARTLADVRQALLFARERQLPIEVLGGGSNMIFSDKGFAGLVLRIGLRGLKFQEKSNSVLAKAAAGENWDDFVATDVARGWAGVECLSGIPGQTGATPVQNVGAYGQEVKDTIVSLRAIDRASLVVKQFNNKECGFAYRSSRFKHQDKNKYIITEVVFRLEKNSRSPVYYPELQKYVAGHSLNKNEPTLAEVRAAVLALRKTKSMLLDKEDPNSKSCGSFFTNPIVSAAQYAMLASSYPDMPNFPAGGGLKIPAAWLVQTAGFNKGYRAGEVGISRNHALAIINRGQATTADILGLARAIQDKVQEKFGIKLEFEPAVAGQ